MFCMNDRLKSQLDNLYQVAYDVNAVIYQTFVQNAMNVMYTDKRKVGLMEYACTCRILMSRS